LKRWLVVYEDREWRSLRPLTDLTAVPAIVFGASDLTRRWRAAFGVPLLSIEARRDCLAAWTDAPPLEGAGAAPEDEVLIANAAAIPGPWLDALLGGGSPALLLGDGRIAGARLPLAMIRPALGRGETFESALLECRLETIAVDALFLAHPWDVIESNADAIADDLAEAPAEIRGNVHRVACLEAPERIHVAAGAVVEAFAVLDARGGPIHIGAGARVAAHTVVTGPCVIGAGTELLGGVVVRSTLGPQCRVAGEVEECVWQGYGNKRHHGFVGHSWIGEWVNLGALTTTSDLKNNYGSIRVWVDGTELDSGRSKIGSLIGAHVKTGIGTLLTTGASLGIGSNLFGGGRFAPKHVPSFSWWDGTTLGEHALDRFLLTARTVMGRRGRALLPADEALLRSVFAATAAERGA
jgi:UDP-N-acetylglucosamine diphosphorylase / glucose-1-phosphate thymidylyltransferase / UDP-N-acetylgalactosamine diphosphorylase / glucosamine-1-phosphate N-acetyltransferase / galactosamine-1-phosphate N-acetyltransferase